MTWIKTIAYDEATGKVRDLYERINLWTFYYPGLKDRIEDIEPNLDYELERFAEKHNRQVRLSREARGRFMAFARSSEARWSGNFRDLNNAVVRMATLAPGGRIDESVLEELETLRAPCDGYLMYYPRWYPVRRRIPGRPGTSPGTTRASLRHTACPLSRWAISRIRSHSVATSRTSTASTRA